MDNWTQFGVAGVMLFIFFFIVKYFVSTLRIKDKQYIELTEKFIKIAEDSVIEKVNLKNAIDANTQMTKLSSEISKQNADTFTSLVMKVIKEK